MLHRFVVGVGCAGSSFEVDPDTSAGPFPPWRKSDAVVLPYTASPTVNIWSWLPLGRIFDGRVAPDHSIAREHREDREGLHPGGPRLVLEERYGTQRATSAFSCRPRPMKSSADSSSQTPQTHSSPARTQRRSASQRSGRRGGGSPLSLAAFRRTCRSTLPTCRPIARGTAARGWYRGRGPGRSKRPHPARCFSSNGRSGGLPYKLFQRCIPTRERG